MKDYTYKYFIHVEIPIPTYHANITQSITEKYTILYYHTNS